MPTEILGNKIKLVLERIFELQDPKLLPPLMARKAELIQELKTIKEGTK